MSATAAQKAKLAKRLGNVARAVSKMRSVWTRCAENHHHQSRKEAARCDELYLLRQVGQITDLHVGVRYKLEVNGQKICDYIADFTYLDKRTKPRRFIVEDVKGRRAGVQYQLFRLKAKLFKAIHGIEITET